MLPRLGRGRLAHVISGAAQVVGASGWLRAGRVVLRRRTLQVVRHHFSRRNSDARHEVEQMQSSLQSLEQAQAAFHEDHARFAEDLMLLLEEYGFQPVGDATVTLHCEGTGPQHGYVARAVHPNTAEQCEVHHGETMPQGEQFTGQIVCTGQ